MYSLCMLHGLSALFYSIFKAHSSSRRGREGQKHLELEPNRSNSLCPELTCSRPFSTFHRVLFFSLTPQEMFLCKPERAHDIHVPFLLVAQLKLVILKNAEYPFRKAVTVTRRVKIQDRVLRDKNLFMSDQHVMIWSQLIQLTFS